MVKTATETAWEVVAAVPDPELPFIDIAELGILRNVETDASGKVTVTITPTYSGCPAMKAIEDSISQELERAGYDDVTIDMVFSPAWTTDWLSDEAKRKLESHGIAPPAASETAHTTEVLCPQCSSGETKVVSVFGSTACKALMVCSSCGEPFDHFKSL